MRALIQDLGQCLRSVRSSRCDRGLRLADCGIPPWRADTVKFCTDPELVAKVSHSSGRAWRRPQNAIVLWHGM